MKMYHQLKKGVHFTAHSHIPMLDWDWPNVGHKQDECVTITNLKDVLIKLESYLEKHPDQSIRVYVTPGGVRAFFLGKWMSTEEFFVDGDGTTLDADPFYVDISNKKGFFPARVSPKANRPGDFVASYVCTLGAKPNAEMLRTLESYHDQPIKRFRDTKVKVVTQQW